MDKNALQLASLAFPGVRNSLDYAFAQTGKFSLSDSNTCNGPRNVHCDVNCNKDLLNLYSDREVTILAFDEWLSKKRNERCDYILFDSGEEKLKFAFCELTCSRQEYVDPSEGKIGKRAKAFNQITESWMAISKSENPVFKAYVLQFVEKIGIFGWRERKVVCRRGASDSMQRFSRVPGYDSSINVYPCYLFGENFRFIQVKYPAEYQWQGHL